MVEDCELMDRAIERDCAERRHLLPDAEERKHNPKTNGALSTEQKVEMAVKLLGDTFDLSRIKNASANS